MKLSSSQCIYLNFWRMKSYPNQSSNNIRAVKVNHCCREIPELVHCPPIRISDQHTCPTQCMYAFHSTFFEIQRWSYQTLQQGDICTSAPMNNVIGSARHPRSSQISACYKMCLSVVFPCLLHSLSEWIDFWSKIESTESNKWLFIHEKATAYLLRPRKYSHRFRKHGKMHVLWGGQCLLETFIRLKMFIKERELKKWRH